MSARPETLMRAASKPLKSKATARTARAARRDRADRASAIACWDYRNNRLLILLPGLCRIYNMSVDEISRCKATGKKAWRKSTPTIATPTSRLITRSGKPATTRSSIVVRNDGEMRWLREVGVLQKGRQRNVSRRLRHHPGHYRLREHARDLEDQQELARQVEAITDDRLFHQRRGTTTSSSTSGGLRAHSC